MPDPTQIQWGLFGLWYVVFLFSLTCHEGAHALLAYVGGDETAYHGGQVTLNPLPHIRQEPFGTLLLPVISFLFFGWVMGWASTPYDPSWAQRHRRRAAVMSLAGPAANFLLAILAFVAARILLAAGILVPPERFGFAQVLAAAEPGTIWAPLAVVLSMTLVLNVLLGFFNLLPVPPLDGSGVLEGLLPETIADRYREAMAGFRFMGLLIAWFAFGRLVGPLFGGILWALYPATA